MIVRVILFHALYARRRDVIMEFNIRSPRKIKEESQEQNRSK